MKLKAMALIVTMFSAGAAVAGPFANNGELYSIEVAAPTSQLTRAQVKAELVAAQAKGEASQLKEFRPADEGFVSKKTRAQVRAEQAADWEAHRNDDPTKSIYFGG